MIDTKLNTIRDLPIQNRRELGEATGTPTEQPSGGFGQILSEKLGEVESLQSDADRAVKRFALGNGEGLQEAVVALEKASLSFEMMMKVRGKIVEAYQDIMRMPV
ncbi:MAG: flagellar hook-basal body complex protein FliE [bacterium]